MDTYSPNSMYNIIFVAHINDKIMNRRFKYIIRTNNPDKDISYLDSTFPLYRDSIPYVSIARTTTK